MQLNQLVDLVHREADSICHDLLHMVLPKSGTSTATSYVSLSCRQEVLQNQKLERFSGMEYDSDDWDGEEAETDDEADDDHEAEEANEAERVIAATRDMARDCELHERA